MVRVVNETKSGGQCHVHIQGRNSKKADQRFHDRLSGASPKLDTRGYNFGKDSMRTEQDLCVGDA